MVPKRAKRFSDNLMLQLTKIDHDDFESIRSHYDLGGNEMRGFGRRAMLNWVMGAGMVIFGSPISALAQPTRTETNMAPAQPGTIGRFVEAVNRGDTVSFLAFFPKDGVVNDWGRKFVGHDAIRAWSDREFIGAKGRMTIKSIEQTGNEIRVAADWKSNFYSGDSRFVFMLDGEQIREMRITSDK
jgi:hypothetical protein